MDNHTGPNQPANRPYLVIPRLIEQPTWGGEYIAAMKNWGSLPFLAGKKIGQSYEVFGQSKLATTITNTQDPRFLPEMASASGDLLTEQYHDYDEGEFIQIQSLFDEPFQVLIKFTQAMGNSFQLHVPDGTHDARWLPKPESWYYFEPGRITCGVKKGADLTKYKKVCKEIESMMIDLSKQVQSGDTTYDEATQQAKETIAMLNPWQFVNIVDTKKDELIDLSMGAIHHSWEADPAGHPNGNILYEVQLDVMDPRCTIRSFDQGKMKSDGTIREIHIDDYFKYINTDPAHNDISTLRRTRQGEQLLRTPYYNLDVLELSEPREKNTAGSFHHLFVKEGEIQVESGGTRVRVTQGHSCFVPRTCSDYTLTPGAKALVLLTFVE